MNLPLDNKPIRLEDIPGAKPPWTLLDTWIGLAMLVLIQIGLVVVVYLFKPPAIYGSAGIIFLELIYILPVVIILAWRRARWVSLGYRKFSLQFIGIGCGFLAAGYFITLINNIIFLRLGWSIQADQILKILSQIPSPTSFVFTGVVLAPVVEETFFRGFLFAGFRQKYGWVWAALLSSAAFAIAHLEPAALVPTFVLGFIFSYLYQKSNSIFPGMLMHFLVNGVGFLALLALTRMGGVIPH